MTTITDLLTIDAGLVYELINVDLRKLFWYIWNVKSFPQELKTQKVLEKFLKFSEKSTLRGNL